MKVLVTGSNGQLGSDLKRATAGLTGDFHFLYTDRKSFDLSDFNLISGFKDIGSFDLIINCAAYTAVDKAEEQPREAFETNATAVSDLVRLCNLHEIHIVHISTDFVFDGSKNLPYSENDKPNPVSIYGKSKHEGEKEILKKAFSYSIFRTSWLYSEHGANFVKTIIKNAQIRPELKVVYDQIGTPTNSKDLADIIVKYILFLRTKRKDLSGIRQLFHYSNEGVASWYDFACAIVEELKLDCRILPVRTEEYPTAAIRPIYSVLDKRKIKDYLNISIAHWRKSLRLSISDIACRLDSV